MRIPEIESHLREKLPVIYPSFSDNWLSISAATVSSNVMTLTVANTFSVDDKVIISGLIYHNPISFVTLNSIVDKAIIKMSEVHEFTEGFSEELTISGANESGWNDTFEILSVPSRYEVEIKINTSITTEPTGAPLVEEINLPRYNQLFTIAAATATDFQVTTVNATDGALFGSGEAILLNSVNISSDVDFERVLNSAYTKQDRDTVWLFVIAGATASSRSRENKTDFEQSFQEGESRIIRTQDNFSVFSIHPTFQDVSAVQAQDIARNELRQALVSLLVGFVPSSVLTSNSDMIYYVADGIETYNGSYYIHRYDFAVNVNITPDDTYVADSYAVRKINSTYIDQESKFEIAEDKIDFTEVP